MAAMAAALCMAATPLAAQTADHSRIQQLISRTHYAQALQEVNTALEKNPRDPQLQFLRANAQWQLGQTDEAEENLLALTRQYPELPEPYNNLAAIKASKGELQEARQLLEHALLNKPDYAQAHENLGDVLTRIAVEHLQQAQQQSPSSARAKKIERLQEAIAP